MIRPFFFEHLQETSSQALLAYLFSSRFGRTHHKTGYLPAPFLIVAPWRRSVCFRVALMSNSTAYDIRFSMRMSIIRRNRWSSSGTTWSRSIDRSGGYLTLYALVAAQATMSSIDLIGYSLEVSQLQNRVDEMCTKLVCIRLVCNQRCCISPYRSLDGTRHQMQEYLELAWANPPKKTISYNENVSDNIISVDSLPLNLLLSRTPIRYSSHQPAPFSRPVVLRSLRGEDQVLLLGDSTSLACLPLLLCGYL